MGREVCAACDFPQRTCLCPAIPEAPLPTPFPIHIIQHPHEARKPLNTARLLPRALAQCHIHTGRSSTALPKDITALPPHSLLVLFPSPCSRKLTELSPAEIARIRAAIVLDGTWKQAREMFAASQALVDGAQCVTLHDLPPSLTVFRKNSDPGHVSTYEAVVGLVCGAAPSVLPHQREIMMGPLALLSRHQVGFIRSAGGGVHRPDRPGYRPDLLLPPTTAVTNQSGPDTTS